LLIGGGKSYLNATEEETIEFGTPKVGIEKYPESFEYQWFLFVPEGRQVQIDFDTFELEQSDKCKNDYIEVREASILGGNPRQFIGHYGPILVEPRCTNPGTIQSKGNMVWVHFKSNSNSTTVYKGFKASFKAGLCVPVSRSFRFTIVYTTVTTNYPKGVVQESYVLRVNISSTSLVNKLVCRVFLHDVTAVKLY